MANQIHQQLNTKLWSKDDMLLPDVKEKILDISNYFIDYLDADIDVVDIQIVGSSASYNYTNTSDLDVHLICNFGDNDNYGELMQAYCNAKRSSFNKEYDITIREIEVEIYVEDIKSSVMSNGIYSVLFDKWIKKPKPLSNVQIDLKDEYGKWEKHIEKVIKENDYDSIKKCINTLYLIRKNSLNIDGEFGKGNLLFKEVRSNGLLDKLKGALVDTKSKDLSITEMRLHEAFLSEESRSQLINKSKQSIKGRNRFKRRVKSKVANSVREFNSIDMNKLFKDNTLIVNINVRGETDNYVVRIKYSGFLDKLRDEIDAYNGALDLRIITRALIKGFNSDDVYIHCNCLHPSTQIKLLDGTTPTIEEMCERFNNGEQLYVYSVDDKGDFTPGKVEKVWKTSTSKEFIKVTLDNGESVMTTSEHPYMLRTGKYVLANELTVGDSLMPSHNVVAIEHIILDNPIDVYDIKVEEQPNFLVNAGVILHNCPDAQYRFNYWQTRNGTNSGEPEGRPSDITNPNDTLGSSCKHVLMVLSNTSWILSVASVINNYIKYMKQHYEKAYADIIYPAIYGKEYEEPVQQTFLDKGLAGEEDTDELDRANEYGRKSTQFQKGNTMGVRFAPNPKGEQQNILDNEA